MRKGLAGTIGLKDITPRVLSRELKALTEMGLLTRKAHNVVPPKVGYALTAEARTSIPVIAVMHKWGVEPSSVAEFSVGRVLCGAEKARAKAQLAPQGRHC